MWLRGATSSLLVSFLFAFAYLWFVENQSFSQAFQGNLVFLTLFFFLGIYTSSMIIVYGKQIKRRIRREKVKSSGLIQVKVMDLWKEIKAEIYLFISPR